ncbi:MAG: c-type cytochrome [Betaproteobacteria bacterium]
MKTASIALAIAGLAFAAGASAQSGEDLLKKNGCTACHSIDKKVVGPSYKEVAAKYRGDSSAPTKLMEKVKKGGAGVWGQVPMPPNPQVSDPDLKTMVTFVLNLDAADAKKK